jgi:disulfide oxidoreductase YuzD
MERTYRFTLGERLQKEMTDIFLNVYRANNVTDKTTHIEHARENVEIVRLLFRLAYDEKQFSTKQYVETNEKIESISKQLAAWKKSTRSFR